VKQTSQRAEAYHVPMRLLRQLADFNRRSRVLCPFCLSEFSRNQILWVSENPALSGSSTVREDQRMRLRESETRRLPGDRIVDPLGTEVRLRACPEASCRRVLPDELLRNRTRVLTVVGSSASGKSTLIAGMMHSARLRLERAGIAMAPVALTQNSVWRLIPNVFERAHCMEPTAIERDFDTPLFLSVGRSNYNGLLVIHEVDLANPVPNISGDGPNRRLIQKSDAVLCVLDPLQIPTVRASVIRDLDVAGVEVDARDPAVTSPFADPDALSAWGTILSGSRTGRSRNPIAGRPPIAVALTKMDVWAGLLKRLPDLVDSRGSSSTAIHRLRSRIAARISGAGPIDARASGVARAFAPSLTSVIDQNFLVQDFFCTQALGSRPVPAGSHGAMGVVPSEVQPKGCDVLFCWLLARMFSTFDDLCSGDEDVLNVR